MDNYIEELDWDVIRKKIFLIVRKYKSSDISNTCIYWDIDRIIKRLKDPEDPLSWFIGRTSENILTELVASWITTFFTDRKLLSQLKYKGMRYDYTSLIGEPNSANQFKDSDIINKKIEEFYKKYFKIQQHFNPETYVPVILLEIKLHDNYDYSQTFENLKNHLNFIKEILLCEKNLAKCYDLELIYYVRCAQYIKVAELVVSELLYSIIVQFRNQKQIESLEGILKGVSILREEVEYYVRQKGKLSYQMFKVNQEGKTSSAVSHAFVLSKQYSAYSEESKQIEELLENDIDNKEDSFEHPAPFKYAYTNQYPSDRQLVIDLKEKESISSDDYVRLKKTREYIDFANKQGEQLGEPNNIILLRIIYREIFMNKAKLPDPNRNLTASTIAQKRLKKRPVDNRQIIFLEKKIERGYFREFHVLSEYKLFNKIKQEYRLIMKELFNLPNDYLMYQTINNVSKEMIDIIKSQYTLVK